MKIRQDFVTNSSSVSYIVTFCPSLFDVMDRHFKDEKKDRIKDIVKNDIVKSGTRVYWEGVQLYVKKYEFSTDEATTDDQIKDQDEVVDFQTISDDDLWNYIQGQYIAKGDLGQIYGFGVTQVDTF